jgi:hypothetical protein
MMPIWTARLMLALALMSAVPAVPEDADAGPRRSKAAGKGAGLADDSKTGGEAKNRRDRDLSPRRERGGAPDPGGHSSGRDQRALGARRQTTSRDGRRVERGAGGGTDRLESRSGAVDTARSASREAPAPKSPAAIVGSELSDGADYFSKTGSSGAYKVSDSPMIIRAQVELGLARERRALELLHASGDPESLDQAFELVHDGYKYIRAGGNGMDRINRTTRSRNPLLAANYELSEDIRAELRHCMREIRQAMNGQAEGTAPAVQMLEGAIGRLQTLLALMQ